MHNLLSICAYMNKEQFINLLFGSVIIAIYIESGLTLVFPNHKFKWKRVFGYYLLILALNGMIYNVLLR